MNKELIINVGRSEITIVLAEDKQLVELNKESLQTGFAVGDIYLGKVRKIMPGLNAAFVNIGHEKDAFVHYLDLGPQFASLQKMTNVVTNPGTRRRGGPFSFQKLKLEPPVSRSGKISTMLTPGQNIVVQVTKEAISTKGPRITSDISLAGRNVVLMPFSNKISISQKIRSNEERKRLKKIATEVLPNNFGVIIRTAAMGKGDSDIEQDIRSMIEKWDQVLANLPTATAPALLLGEMNRTNTIIRDSLNGSFSAITVDDATMYDEIREYIKQIAPEKEKIVKLYKGKVSILDHFDISRQIKSLFSKYVSLKRGAYLIVEHTEAMNVIDVNSGNRAKAEDQESTAMEVNLMAAEEISRQLRLRDMGGLIIIDFIDLGKAENRQKLYKKMQEHMAGDKAKHTILPISKFGLMQITRQRVRPEAIQKMEEVCPMCGGTGKVSSTVSLDTVIENRIAYLAGDKKIKFLQLMVSPYVGAYIRKGCLSSLRHKWMRRYHFRLKVTDDQSVGVIEYKFLDRKGRTL